MIIIERFEDDTAVIERDGVFEKIPKNMIEKNASEGDILIEKDGIYTVDKTGTQKRREEMIKLQNSLWE